jgi:hypothetical protein
MLLVVAGAFIPSLYEKYESVNRYMGLKLGPNLTTSIFILLLIVYFEYQKIVGQRLKLKLVILTILFATIAFTTKSRGFMLSGLIYLFYNYIRLFNKKYVYSIAIIGVILIVVKFVPELQDNLRITGDGSFETRLALYLTIINELNESFYMIPHGFEADQLLLNSTRFFKGVELHNDALKYLYNFGFLFLVYLVYVGRKLRFYFNSKEEYLIIIFILLLNALQNTLFNIFILVPLMGLLMIKKYSKEIKV